MATTTEILLRATIDNKQSLVGIKEIVSGLGAVQNSTVAEQLAAAKLQQTLGELDRTKALKQLALDAVAGITPLNEVLQKLDAMSATDTELKRLATDMNSYADAAQRAADSTNQIAAAPRGVRDIGMQLDALPDPAIGAFEGEGEGDTGGGLSLGGGRSALRAGGFLLGSDAGGGALRGAGQVVALVSALGPVGALAAAGAVGLRALTSAEDEAEKSFEARLDTERQAAHEIGELTQKQVQDKIKSAQLSLDIDNEIGRQQAANGALYTLSIVDQPLKLGAALAGLDPQYNAYQDALAKNKVAIEGDSATIDVLTKLVNENATASADAAEAAKKLADQQIASANLALDVDKLTTDQRKDRAAQDQRDIALINSQIQSGKLGEQATYDLLMQQDKLYKDYQALIGVTSTYGDVLDLQTKAIQSDKDASDGLNDVLQQENQAKLDVADASEKVKDALSALGEAESTHKQNLIDIQDQFSTAEQDALTKRNEKLIEIDANLGKQLIQQHLQDNLSIRDAEGRSSFSEVQRILANQKIHDQQDRQQATDQKTQTNKAYDDSLKAANEQNRKLLDTEAERYQKESKQREDAYTKALQDERAKNAALAALQQEKAMTETYWADYVQSAYDKLHAAQKTLADGMAADAQRFQSLVSGASGGSNVSLNSVGYGLGQGVASILSKAQSSLSLAQQNRAPNGAPYQQSLFYSGFKETVGGSGTPFDPRMGGGASFRAGGGDVKAGVGYYVGEKGMEWFQPKTDGYIVPNDKLGGMRQGGSNLSGKLDINVHATGDSEANRVAATEIAIRVGNQVLKHVGNGIDQLAVN